MSQGSRDAGDDFSDGLHVLQQAWEARDSEFRALRELLRERTQRVKALETKNADLEGEALSARRRMQALEAENAELKALLRQMEQSRTKFESLKKTLINTLQGSDTEEDSKVASSPQNSSAISGYSGVLPITPQSQSREPSKQTSPARFVDGKRFFAATRKRLSYEAFSEFLGYIKKVNNKDITREQALEEVRPVFGPENGDLYEDFVVLLTKKALG